MAETDGPTGEPTRRKKRTVKDQTHDESSADLEAASESEGEEEEDEDSAAKSAAETRAAITHAPRDPRSIPSHPPEVPGRSEEGKPSSAERFRFERRTPRRRRR